MFNQMSEHPETVSSKYQCVFRQEINAQFFQLSMTEKLKSAVGNKKNVW